MNMYEKFTGDFHDYLKILCRELHDNHLIEMYNYAVLSGRRHRPALTLTGKLIGDTNYDENTVVLSAAIELIHKYSLILDDYVDNDPLRRGQKTFHTAFGKDNAQAMSAYLMNLLFKEQTKIYKMRFDQRQTDIISNLLEGILSDMSVGFILDINQMGGDVKGIREISNMQTSTLLRNSMLIGYISSINYANSGDETLFNVISQLGDSIGTVFQAYNDLEMFCGASYQFANKGQLYSDITYNRKNTVISRVPLHIKNKRDTGELIKYINDNNLVEEVFYEIDCELCKIDRLLAFLPSKSEGSMFLDSILKEKKAVLHCIDKKSIWNYNDLNNVSAI